MSNQKEIIEKLKQQISQKKETYNELYKKYQEITNRDLRSVSKSPISLKKPNLENLNKKCVIFAAEEKNLRRKISSISISNEIKLAEKVEILKSKLSLLLKENKRLSLANNHNLPPISKPLDSEESLQREVSFHKKNVGILEESLKTFREKIESDIQKAAELESEYENLKGQVKITKEESVNKPFEELDKKLKIITNSWKSNVAKMENILKEKESQLKLLQQQATQVNSKIFKQEQQMRLLDMSHDDMFLVASSGARLGDNPDIYHPDVNFLYKPSVKSLYST